MEKETLRLFAEKERKKDDKKDVDAKKDERKPVTGKKEVSIRSEKTTPVITPRTPRTAR